MIEFAKGTKVTPGRSREEMERLISRFGGDGFGYRYQGNKAQVEFVLQGRLCRIEMIFPGPDDDPDFKCDGRGYSRSEDGVRRTMEQDRRQRWRALVHVLKAKLIGVDSGIMTIEQAFLPYLVCADNQTILEKTIPRLDQVIATGNVLMLPEGKETS